jgi:putative exosortase-associated protein (TIGR04073 family)
MAISKRHLLVRQVHQAHLFPLYKRPIGTKLRLEIHNLMTKRLSFLAFSIAAAVLVSGCANTERKFGRGMMNAYDIVRGGEFRRTMEQTGLFDGPDTAYGLGFVRGVNRTLARTGVGVYEMVTAPFPPYDPVLTDYLAPGPVYPDNYAPNLLEDSMFATDTNLGFSGGDVAPMLPGSRFRIFDAH